MTKKHLQIIKSANEEVIGKGNLDAVADLFSSNYVVHTNGKKYKGHEFINRT